MDALVAANGRVTDAALAHARATDTKRFPYRIAFSNQPVSDQTDGHILDAWLRKMFRQRMNRTGDDPVDTAINRKLNIVRDRARMLRLSEF